MARGARRGIILVPWAKDFTGSRFPCEAFPSVLNTLPRAQLIYEGVVNAGLSAYLYWEGAETDAATNSCLIQISGSTATPSARLWAMAQWSRYVRPGALRVAATSGSSSLLATAFKNTDDTVSVLVINTATSSQAILISVSGGSFGSVVAYVSDDSNGGQPTSMSAALTGGAISATVPDHSLVTFVLSGSSTSTSSSSASSSSTSTIITSTTTSTAPGPTQTKYGQW